MEKQKITVGSIIEINIDNQYYVYAQILKNAGYAFFDYKSAEHLTDFSVLEKAPVLFIVALYNDVITQGYWKKVGKITIRTDLMKQPMQFIQDALSPDKFELYDPNTGEITPAEKSECKGLERVAIYEAEHVEERIRDHYEGRIDRYRKIDLELFNE